MPRTIIIDAELKPSRELALVLAAAHALAAASPWLAGLPVWASVAIAVLVVCWGGWQVRRVAGLRGRHAIMRFRLHGDGRIVVLRRSAEAVDAECVGIEMLGQWGFVLSCQEPGGRATRLLIWRDQCDARTRRRLRIAARWHAGVSFGEGSRSPFRESRDFV